MVWYYRIVLVGCLFASLHGNAQTNPLFELLPSNETGVTFENNITETESRNVLSYEYFYNGGGVGAGDINNDGLIDLYFTANMRPDKLFLNEGGLHFKDITKSAKIKNSTGWKTGVSMADVNGDGLLDIYVCYSGSGNTESRRNKLYINNGDLTFSERAKEYGLDDPAYTTQAAFFDFDKDGDLDVYLVNHSIKDYKEIELKSLKTNYDSLAGDKLLRNDHNHFVDVTLAAGISANPISYGLGISVADLNSDGWMDLYVSNDYHENDYLYLNNGNGTFTESSQQALSHMSNFSMGNDIADFNNDGLPDIMTLDMLPPDNKRQKLLKDPENYELYQSAVANGFHHQFMRNMLHLNNGDGTFSEIGQLAGVSNTDWSWSTLFADFDNDGLKDIFVTNGYLRDYTNRDFLKYWGNYLVQKAMKMEKTYLMEIIQAMPSTKKPNFVFQNNGDLTFTDRAASWGVDQSVLSNGAAYADLDNDGDLEIIVNNVNEQASIYKNNASASHGYIDIMLKSASGKATTIGSKVFLYASSGMQMLEQNPVRGFQSSVSTVLHFGIADLPKVDSIVVQWPDGKTQKIIDAQRNQRIEITESGEEEIQKRIHQMTFFTPDTTIISFDHRDHNHNDFKRQPMMPFMYSYVSPIVAKGDLNNDGLEDVFIGSSKGQGCKIFLQQKNGSFEEKLVNPRFYDDRNYVTSDAVFFDADKDGDLDLYATSGMYQDYNPNAEQLNDRLYFNDGTASFTKRTFIPNNANGKSCARPCDYDNDGDLDVFVGGRIIPGNYPLTPESYFLQNDGTGNFIDVSVTIGNAFKNSGMVTDARWVDLNHDNRQDLIICGDWMPVSVYINLGDKFEDQTSNYFAKSYSGFWNTILADDIDQDGDVDLIAGNLGTNTQIKASDREPAELIYRDFDNNGSIDPFLCYYIQGVSYPDMSRDLLLDQIYPLRKKFTSYESYSTATISDIFPKADINLAKRYTLNEVETCLFINEKGKFVKTPLPVEAQFSPVTSVECIDVNGDGSKDLILLGNFSHARLKYGEMDANFGMVLIRSSNNFSYAPQVHSGLRIKGDVKSSAILKTAGGTLLLAGINQRRLAIYRLNPNRK